MQRSVAPLLVLGVLAASARPQGTGSETIPRLPGVSVASVLVDLRVMDHRGRPVTDLRPENLELEVDGQPVAVEWMRWVPEDRGPAPRVPVPAPLEDAAAPGRPGPGRLVVMLFEKDLGDPARLPGLLIMRQRASEFVDRLGRHDRVAVASFDSHLRLWLDFAAGRREVRRAIERAVMSDDERPVVASGEPPSLAATFDAEAARKAGHLESALLVLARALRSIPGHKSLALFAAGMGRSSGGVIRPHLDYNQAVAALARARVTVFSLDITAADYHDLEAGLRWVAQDTGGFYVKTHDRAAQAMALVEQALRGHYEVAFEAPPQSGWHRLEVRLRGRSGEVQAPRSFET